MSEVSHEARSAGTDECLGAYTAQALKQIRDAASRGESSVAVHYPYRLEDDFREDVWIDSVRMGLHKLGYKVEVTHKTTFDPNTTPEYNYDRCTSRVEVSW